MAGEASKAISKEELWDGGRSPFSVSYGKMMMWFFLVSDALTFGGLLVAYGAARGANTEVWPIGEQVFNAFPGLGEGYPLFYVATMTFILIVSSVTMVLAVEAGHRKDQKGVLKWMLATIIGGFFFLGSQAWEWSHFIHGGGGHYNVQQPVAITYVDDDGAQQTYTVSNQEHVYMGHHFGAALEHYQLHGLFHGYHVHGHGETGHGAHGHDAGHHAEGTHADEDHAEHGGDHGAGHAEAAGHSEMDEHSEHILEELHHLGIDEAKILEITHKSSIAEAFAYAAEKEHHGEKIFMAHAQPDELVINKYIENKIVLDHEANAAAIGKLWNANTVEKGSFYFGAGMKDNEYGPQNYANFFFFVTGFHGFHVFSGVIINIIIFFMAVRGVFERRGHYEMVEKVGLYWHFVDLVWVFVFTFFYLV